jgi:hypothetical protein
VAAAGSLLAIFVGLGRGEPLGDEVVGVPPDRGWAVQLGGGPVAAAQVELRAERMPRDRVESLVE